jgi:hypothetical protein
MVASKLKLIFLILLSLHLSVIFSKQNDGNNGISMTLHMSSDDLQGYERVAKMVQASKDRAWALKHGMHNHHHMKMKRKSKSLKEMSVQESLYASSVSVAYFIKFSVGTPPQADLLLIMDTGSDLVWVPCTGNYTCNNCPQDISASNGVFLPGKSSSAQNVKCADPKCKELYCRNANGRCSQSLQSCSGACPDYLYTYGKGSTTGHLVSETFTLPLEGGGRREVKNFGVGCSVVSSKISGIAGFGRGGLSMPSQLGPLIGDKFAYCLQSHQLFDDQNKSSRMVLGDMAVPKDIPLNYTPFLINSTVTASFSHYYIGLEGVSIGGKRLKLPSNLLSFDSKGNGGTIIDSGTSFTIFPEAIYKQIVDNFASQIAHRRAPDLEATTGLGLCYNFSGVENIQLPEFAFLFKGGSDMVLPDENCFMQIASDSFCLAMLNTSILENAVGPAALLGNYQQQNLYILYDREKNRLGFTQQNCKTFG